jgi:hypothetical protein
MQIVKRKTLEKERRKKTFNDNSLGLHCATLHEILRRLDREDENESLSKQ